MKDRTEVCPLSRGVMLPGGATPISFITKERSLSPSSSIRNPIGVPYGSLSLSGELRTFHVPLACLDGLGPCLFAGDVCVSDGGNWIPPYPSRTFWFKPISTFGLFVFTTFNSSSHLLAIPSNSSALATLVLAAITFLHSSVTLFREATLSRKLPHPWITPSAGFGRVLVGEHQVESCYPVSTATQATSCRNQLNTKT